MDELPTIRLKPNADARRIRHGAPWVYANEIVTDRRTRALAPGSIAQLVDTERRFTACVAVNPASKIFARVLSRNADEDVGRTWLETRIAQASALRKRLYKGDFYRLIHAEGDGLPGLIVDRFGDTLVLQPNTAWAETHLEPIIDTLQSVSGAKVILKNASGRARALEGLDDASQVLIGDAPDKPLTVPMNGAIYLADLTGGQKTGLFFDQRPNHAFVAGLAKGARVLDVFTHVGGFALAALAAGADHALGIDASASALDLARKGAAETGVADRFTTEQADAFDALSALVADKAAFDVVICDPPAFAPQKSALEAGLRAYERVARLASQLVAPGGILMLCSCSHAATLDKFRNASLRGIGRAGREGRLIYTGFAGPDHPQHPYLAESGYLKAVGFSL
jgi:23S rRNA (cytosine1962-C5)-methyltransferase